MKSSRSGAISRPITSPTRPSQTSPPSTKPSMTPSSISTASASPICWPCQESLLSRPSGGILLGKVRGSNGLTTNDVARRSDRKASAEDARRQMRASRARLSPQSKRRWSRDGEPTEQRRPGRPPQHRHIETSSGMRAARRWSTTQGERGRRLGERERERGLCASVDHSFYVRCNQSAPPLFFGVVPRNVEKGGAALLTLSR